MKSLDFLKEGFVEDASEAHQDHEVQMARQECFNAAENALALHKLLRNISEAQGLEGWVSSKITLANDYLRRVREYLEYEFLTKDINEITPEVTIAENAESKKKLIEYKIVSGQEGKTQNYVITGLDTKTLDQLARAYYGAIKLEQDPKNPNVTTIVWDLPTAGPAPYGSYDAKSGTATFIKKMTDAGDQLAKSVKKIDQAVEEGRSVSAGIDNISSAKKLWQYVRRNLTDLASNAEFYADLNKLYIEDRLSNLLKTADGQQVKIAFTTGGGIKFDQGILYIPIGVMWYYRGMYTSESFVNGVINALNGKQEMEEGLDLDQQAMTVADRLTSGKNLEKLQAMRHDSTVYRALDRYFAKNNIPENIYNRVAHIVFQKINQQGVAEAFGAGRAEDFAVHPKSAREKIGANIATLGMITGAIAGFTLTPDGFWGTTGGILGGMFVGATLGREIHGNKDAKIRQEKMKKLASNFVSSQPGLKYDFEVFLNSLYNDSPFNKLGALNHWEDIEDVYDKQKELLDREIRQWLDHYEKEWESLNNAYKIPNTWLLRYAFELIYGKSVMEQWLDKMRKMGERGIYRTPFSSLDTTNKNNTHPNDPNDRIEPTLNLDKFQEGVAKGKKCNHTMEGTECPIHGLTECPMQENKKLKETSAGSVAGVNNPPGKNSGKKKSQIGSLFGGTYKQTVHETDFAGEKTTPPQKPGDQVRGTEKPIKKGKQQPFYHRLVGNE